MRRSNIAPIVAFSIAALTLTPFAHAGSRGIRADAPCPFSGGGDNSWSPVSNPSSSPFNPGAPTANFAELEGGATNGTDDLGNLGGSATALDVTSGTMYNWYSAPIPAASLCSSNQINGNFAPIPVEQVMEYTLASGDQLGDTTLPANLTEIEFNYASSESGVSGTASFQMGGITYTSEGGSLPALTGNDFLFNPNGSLYGAISEDGTFLEPDTLPEGWKSSVTAAPELDPGTLGAALTLLGGSLLVLRGRKFRGSPKH